MRYTTATIILLVHAISTGIFLRSQWGHFILGHRQHVSSDYSEVGFPAQKRDWKALLILNMVNARMLSFLLMLSMCLSLASSLESGSGVVRGLENYVSTEIPLHESVDAEIQHRVRCTSGKVVLEEVRRRAAQWCVCVLLILTPFLSFPIL